MTDLTAPERVMAWADENPQWGPQWKCCPLPMMPKTAFSITEYIRADIHRAEVDALVAAAYDDAASEVGEHLSTPEDVIWAKDAAERILDHTPADARAALRAHTEAAVRRALEAAANVVSGCDRVSEVQPAIRALAPAQFIGGGE